MLSMVGDGLHLRLAQERPWKSWSVKESSCPRRLGEGEREERGRREGGGGGGGSVGSRRDKEMRR